MSTASINLARKWRSKQFSEIVGQTLSVRILQNSLYLKQFFPVYLFAGQRGCGKTSTARVFAAAVNCQGLVDFQKSPKKHTVPCLKCESCAAMQEGRHPDFIEIDAASHTGVDNVRNIIDASSFLPLMGNKKIYLIDEAHMLSKAAFNAFLKILEEPPASVIFILATTDRDKILETVKSRCFQLFFDPIASTQVVKHLATICKTEKVACDEEGLSLIAQESQGSLRDAINILEQVRFSTKKITKQAVQKALGHVDEETVLSLMQAVYTHDIAHVHTVCEQLQTHSISIEFLWQELIAATYDMILVVYGMMPKRYYKQHEQLEQQKKSVSLDHVLYIFEMLCEQEVLMYKTSQKLLFLQISLLRCMHLPEEMKKKNNIKRFTVVSSKNKTAGQHGVQITATRHEPAGSDDVVRMWQLFVESIALEQDPIMTALFQEADCRVSSTDAKKLEIVCLKKFALFSDILETQKQVWHTHFYGIFDQSYQVVFRFDKIGKEREKRVVQQPTYEQKQAAPQSSQHYEYWQGKSLDISDTSKWEKTHMILQHFPGKVYEIKGESHES